jgi:hypothetical protein
LGNEPILQPPGHLVVNISQALVDPCLCEIGMARLWHLN